MAALPPVPKVFEVILGQQDGGGANISNRFYMSYTQNAAASDLTTLLGIVASSWSANIATHMVANQLLTSITINDLNSNTGAKVAEQLSIPGTASGTRLTSGVSLVLSKKESLKYRGGHSRNYFAGMTEGSSQDPNTWSTALQTAMATAWSTFISQIISAAPAALGALKEVVVHRYGKSASAPVKMDGYRVTALSVPLADPIVSAITGYVVNPQVASQRRRNQQS